MKPIITVDRIRTIVSSVRTEQDIMILLRSHKVKASFTTETGYLSIRIPCRKGVIRIYRTCSRSQPFAVMTETPRPVFPIVRASDI